MSLTKFFINRLSAIAVLAVVTVFATTSASSAPAPIQIDGNISCAGLVDLPTGAYGGAFDHMISDGELKLDPDATGTYPFVNGGNVSITDMTANPNLFLNVVISANGTALTSWSLSWTSPVFADRFVSAIIVKGGPNGSNVYPYNPLDAGDTGNFTVPTPNNAISHLSFCFEPGIGVSAADAVVSGRVLDRGGRGISSAILTISNLSTGTTQNVITNSFGNYSFKGLPVGDFYTLNIRHSRYTFMEPTRTFQLDDNLAGTDFTSLR